MKQVLHEGTVRVGLAVAIPRLLRSLGADPASVFTEAGIDLDLFDDPDNVIPYVARAHLVNVCVARTGCQHFGLMLGQQGSLSSFGLFGCLARHSQNVGSALRSLQRFFHLHVQGARLQLTQEGSLARFSYNTYEPQIGGTHQIEDGAMAWAVNILRELCGRDFNPTEVHFVHEAPKDLRPYRKLFKAPLSFNSLQGGLYLPTTLLKKALKDVDPEFQRLLRKEVESQQAKFHDDILDSLKRVLHSILCVRATTANDVAKLFSMSARTLNRRLKLQGTTFGEVVDEVKSQIACQILSDSEMKLTELADFLHYSDSSSFIKAFKRWTGTTPAHWRRRNNDNRVD